MAVPSVLCGARGIGCCVTDDTLPLPGTACLARRREKIRAWLLCRVRLQSPSLSASSQRVRARGKTISWKQQGSEAWALQRRWWASGVQRRTGRLDEVDVLRKSTSTLRAAARAALGRLLLQCKRDELLAMQSHSVQGHRALLALTAVHHLRGGRARRLTGKSSLTPATAAGGVPTRPTASYSGRSQHLHRAAEGPFEWSRAWTGASRSNGRTQTVARGLASSLRPGQSSRALDSY